MRNAARLRWRIWAFFVGAALGLAGIVLEVSWLVTAGLIVLFGGVLIRIWAARASGKGEQVPGARQG